jgi:hypothetical protein
MFQCVPWFRFSDSNMTFALPSDLQTTCSATWTELDYARATASVRGESYVSISSTTPDTLALVFYSLNIIALVVGFPILCVHLYYVFQQTG